MSWTKMRNIESRLDKVKLKKAMFGDCSPIECNECIFYYVGIEDCFFKRDKRKKQKNFIYQLKRLKEIQKRRF